MAISMQVRGKFLIGATNEALMWGTYGLLETQFMIAFYINLFECSKITDLLRVHHLGHRPSHDGINSPLNQIKNLFEKDT